MNVYKNVHINHAALRIFLEVWINKGWIDICVSRYNSIRMTKLIQLLVICKEEKW